MSLVYDATAEQWDEVKTNRGVRVSSIESIKKRHRQWFPLIDLDQ